MTCGECRGMMVDLICGEMSKADREAIYAHIDDCDFCTTVFGQVKQSVRDCLLDNFEQHDFHKN